MSNQRRLAEQVQHEERLMAGLILAYQRRHHLDDQALMAYLGIDDNAFARLILARRPRSDHKVQDVLRTAEEVGCKTEVLWSIVEHQADRG